VREFVEATGISYGTVISILHEQLCMKKLSARWVPRLFTVDHKCDRVTISRFNVWRCFNVIQMNFCVNLLLWTKHGSITSHRRNSQTNGLLGKPVPKKAKTIKSAGKMMVTVFWDTRGIIHIDYDATFRRSKRSMAIITQLYWTVSTTF